MKATTAMNAVSVIRLNILRSGYLLLVLGIGASMWPILLREGPRLELMHGAALSMLCAVGLLALLGLRHPLQMLPLLMFEMTWKLIWTLRIALPLWSADRLDADFMGTLAACAIALVFPFVIPWRYVLDAYVRRPADAWRPGARPSPRKYPRPVSALEKVVEASDCNWSTAVRLIQRARSVTRLTSEPLSQRKAAYRQSADFSHPIEAVERDGDVLIKLCAVEGRPIAKAVDDCLGHTIGITLGLHEGRRSQPRCRPRNAQADRG
jgi:hypothetical protein